MIGKFIPKKMALSLGHVEQYNFGSHQLSGEEVGFYFRITVIIGVPQIDVAQFVGDSPVLSRFIKNIVIVEYETFTLVLYGTGPVKILRVKI